MVNTEDGDNELQNEQRGECGCRLGQFSDSHHLSVLSRKKSVSFVWYEDVALYIYSMQDDVPSIVSMK